MATNDQERVKVPTPDRPSPPSETPEPKKKKISESTSVAEAKKPSESKLIAFIGEGGTGKSTIVNALLGAKILPVCHNETKCHIPCEVSISSDPNLIRITAYHFSKERWTEIRSRVAAMPIGLRFGGDADRKTKFMEDPDKKLLKYVYGKGWKKPEFLAKLKDPNWELESVLAALSSADVITDYDAEKDFEKAKIALASILGGTLLFPISRVRLEIPFPKECLIPTDVVLVDHPSLDYASVIWSANAMEELGRCNALYWVVCHGDRMGCRDSLFKESAAVIHKYPELFKKVHIVVSKMDYYRGEVDKFISQVPKCVEEWWKNGTWSFLRKPAAERPTMARIPVESVFHTERTSFSGMTVQTELVKSIADCK